MTYLKGGSGTGGMVYNRYLAESWETRASVVHADIKKRFFQLRCAGLAWLVCHGPKLFSSDWIVQAASSGYHSELIVRTARRIAPHVRHIGIAHHPRWLEKPAFLEAEVRFYNIFDRLVTTACHIKEELMLRGVKTRIDVITPGYVPATLSPQEHPASIPRILWNGHLVERKGPHIVLGALQQLSAEPWQATFLSVSEPDPAYRRGFLNQLEALTAVSRFPVRYMTRLPFSQYLNILNESDYYCLPSTVEGSSVALVEAMAHGCIVLVPRIPTFLESIGCDDYPGFFSAGSPESLASALRSFLRNPESRVRATSILKNRLAQLPTWDQFRNTCAEYLVGLQ